MPTPTLPPPIMERSTANAKGPNVADFSVLDHPIWGALSSVHSSLARTLGSARRYSSEVSPLAALREPTEAAFSDLAALVNSNDPVALFTTAPIKVPGQWRVVRERYIDQMICTEPPKLESSQIQRLGEADIPRDAGRSPPQPSPAHSSKTLSKWAATSVSAQKTAGWRR